MNTIGNNIPVLPAVPKVSAPAPRSAQVLPEARPQTDQPEVTPDRATERARLSAAERAAGQISNSRVLGTGSFVSFQVGGTLVTRYRDEDGRVRYEPEIDPFAEARPGRRVNLQV